MHEDTSQIDFPFAGRRQVRAAFDAGPISSDGGLLLLRQADRRLGLTEALAQALPDWREKRRVEHSDLVLIRQRIYGICAGYEDCNDAKTMRRDPALKAACDRDPDQGADLASQPTLSRFENEVGPKSCYLLAEKLFESYLRNSFAAHPRSNTTDDPLHGQQELRYFSAYYDEYVYQPLLIFDQDGDLIASVLQPGKSQGTRPAVAVLKRIIHRLRKKWPGVSILVRGDSGFASPELYRLCQDNKVDFLVGFGTNQRLKRLAAKLAEQARRRFLRTGNKARLFKAIRYRSMGTGRKRWPRSYRMIIKAEHTEQGSNVRFVVTNLAGDPQKLYDRCYVQRADACENSIKDLKRALKADRLSCHRFWANQFRLLLHAAAYVLMYMLRRAAHGTELADAQMDTLRLRLLKIGVRVLGSARRIWFHLASSHPWQSLWARIARRLLSPQPFGSIAHIPFAFYSPAAGAQPCPQSPIAWAPVRKTGHGSGNGNGNGNGNDREHGAGGRATASVAA